MLNGDTSGYYIHLVSTFINQDAGNYDHTLKSFFNAFPQASYLENDPFWIKETDKGKKAIKYPIGVAIMEAPAFLLAHIYSKIDPNYESTGWTLPFLLAINLAQIIYISIAFYLLFLLLATFFETKISLVALLATALGTNLLFQASFLTMAHTFQFFNVSLLIYLTNGFYKDPTKIKAFRIGAIVGLITLCRIPELIAFLIPISWGIYNKQTWIDRVHFFKRNYVLLLTAAVAMFLIVFPQLAYWNYVSGKIIFNSYEGEGFNFLNPHIFKGWFSYANGWLVYTPLMILGLMGVFFLQKKAPQVILPLILFVGINTYVHYSYYQWNYFPGIGSRPMIESYPLLVFGIAALLDRVWRDKTKKILVLFSIILLVVFNLFKSWQSYEGIIDTARTNRSFFWESFFSTHFTKDNLITLEINEPQPDIQYLHSATTLFSNDFENDTNAFISEDPIVPENKVLEINEPYSMPNNTFQLGTNGIQGGDYIYTSISAMITEGSMNYDWDGYAQMVISIYNQDGKQVRYKGLSLQKFLGNQDYSIWSNGKSNLWDSVSFFVKIPTNAKEDWTFKWFIHIPKNQLIYLDDFSIKVYKKE